jgi:cytochrome c-type biogenesis protein CcmH/NrfG
VACLSFLIHNGADFTFYVPSVGLIFFCLAGLAAASRCPGVNPDGAAASRIPRCIAALALAAFALLLTRADLGKAAARDAVVERDMSLAPWLAAAAVSRNPFDPESRSLYSHVLLDQATISKNPELLRRAERQAQAAIDLDPVTPHHWNHLGHVLLASGDPQGAYVALARAAQLYPIKIEYRQDSDMVGAALAQKPSGAVAKP